MRYKYNKYNVRTGVISVKTKLAIAFTSLALAAGGLGISLSVFGTAHAAGADRYVDSTTGSDSSDCSNTASPCKTIQYAVSQSADGDTIHVDAGSYNENVNVTHSVTLDGPEHGSAVSGRTFGNSSEATVSGVDKTASIPVITVSAPNVIVDGFSITNSVTSGAAQGVAVAASGDNAVIENNLFDTIVTIGNSSDGQATAQAVYLYNGPDGVQITNNSMNNVHSYRSAKGVLLGDNGATNAPDNTLVEGNTMTDITSDAKGAYGVNLADINGGTSGLQIKDNAISGLTSTTGWVHAIGIEGDAPSVVISGNTFSDLTASGTDKIDVWFESEDTDYAGAAVNQNNFNQTSVAGIAVGVAGNDSLNGTCNWWGDPSGPSNAGGGSTATGSGAGVTGLVTYAPWLNSPAPGGACQSGVVTVTIAKYLDGQMATATSANNKAFPMVSTWTASNLNGGAQTSGNYALSPSGYNNPHPYQATTSNMSVGASYTTHEVIGSTVATTCTQSGAPYVLKGYSTGDSLSAAENAGPSSTVPDFTTLQKNQYVVVWNDSCPSVIASGQILKPTPNQHVLGKWLNLKATYTDGDTPNNDDAVQWAVRSGSSCAANTGTVLGNVDGRHDSYNWDGNLFTAKLNIKNLPAGQYCFVFNPTDDPNQPDVRLTRLFYIGPNTKNDCKNDAWQSLGFSSQKACEKYVTKHSGKNVSVTKVKNTNNINVLTVNNQAASSGKLTVVGNTTTGTIQSGDANNNNSGNVTITVNNS